MIARAKARGAGAIAGLLILASARSPVVAIALWRWAMRNPDKVQQVGQAMTEVAGGPPTLTQLPGSRLRPEEVNTGIRLAKQIGANLVESAHIGEEFKIVGTKLTIEAMGTPNAYKFWNASEFTNSIIDHLNKSVDFVAIDLKGASKAQVKAIQEFVSGLSVEQQARIIYVQP